MNNNNVKNTHKTSNSNNYIYYTCKQCKKKIVGVLGIVLGKHYGYPECCINHFIENREKNISNEELKRKVVLRGTGFISCPECSKKSENELLNIINKNRQCNHPFLI